MTIRTALVLALALASASCTGSPARGGAPSERATGGAPVRGASIPKDRTAHFEGAWWQEGMREHERGIWLKVSFVVNNCYDQRCSIVAYFYDENRRPLRDRNREFYTTDGNVSTMEDFRPGFRHARYVKYRLFIPFNEFHLPQGDYDLRFKFTIYWRDQDDGYHPIATSEYFRLPVSWKVQERGEITRLQVDYNAKRTVGETTENGIKVTLDYSVHNMKGREGRFVVEFYYDPRRLPRLYEKGKEEQGVMSYAQTFRAKWDHTDFTGGTYRVSYDVFPLKIGRNTFYFKVWLQVKRDGEWDTLDATNAKEFYVNHGSLTLNPVWIIPDVRVLLDWKPTSEEWGIIRRTLSEFNRRLWDVSDGQVVVDRFSIEMPASRDDFHPSGEHYASAPTFRIYRSFKEGNHGDPKKLSARSKEFIRQMRPFAFLGRPDRPGDAHLTFEKMTEEGPLQYSRALVHEFHHAVFGLNDEYGKVTDEGGRTTWVSFCAESTALRQAWNSCIMGTYQPLLRELCKPDTHARDPGNSKLHSTDCYTRVKAALREARRSDARFRNIPDLVIPDTPVEGPHEPPPARFVWK